MIQKRNSIRGFTLVELLVVVAIIAILAGVSMSAYSVAIRAAQSSKCTSNLRQIAAGFRTYLGDHNMVMPQRVYGDGTPYFIVLNPYTGGSLTDKSATVFVCPTHRANDFPNEPSYGMNWYFDNVSVATLADESNTIMVAETSGSTGSGSNRADRNSGDPGELDPARHYGKSNYLFFDGHIDRLPFSDTVAKTPDMWGTDAGQHSTMTPN